MATGITKLLIGACLFANACAQAPARNEYGRNSIWVAYAHRGNLHRVRADGTDHARLRGKQRRESPESEPDVRLYDLWRDPVARPDSETIAAIRGRNLSFNVHPGDPAEFDQSWELVLVDPSDPERDRVLFTSDRELSNPRWSDDGEQLVAGRGRGDLVIWREDQATVRALVLPKTKPGRAKLLLADFTADGLGVHLLMSSRSEAPYLVGTAKIQPGDLKVEAVNTFPSFKLPAAIRQTNPVLRLFGSGELGSALGPPFSVTPDRRYSFYHRKREGFFPRGWVEGVDGATGEAFEVRTTWRGIYAE